MKTCLDVAVMDRMQEMAEETLCPETFEKWEVVRDRLYANRTTLERPKRMVKKVVEGWVNLLLCHETGAVEVWGDVANSDALFDSESRASLGRTGGVLDGAEWIGPPHFIHHEYEVEE